MEIYYSIFHLAKHSLDVFSLHHAHYARHVRRWHYANTMCQHNLYEAAKLSNLRVAKTDTIKDMMNIFPDHLDLLQFLARPQESVVDVFADMEYDGPPELFTMFCCLFASPDVSKILDARDGKWLQKHRAGLRRLRWRYEAKYGQTPHAAVLFGIYTGKFKF